MIPRSMAQLDHGLSCRGYLLRGENVSDGEGALHLDIVQLPPAVS